MTAPATFPSFELREPVTLVLNSGREVFASSHGLLTTLARVDGKFVRVLQVAEGGRRMTEASVTGLNTYLGHFGLRLFRRSHGPGCWVTKYAWADLKELLGLEFEERNHVVAILPPGSYFGAETSRPVLVAGWDGTFDSLRGAAL